jgi:hypothetical protein
MRRSSMLDLAIANNRIVLFEFMKGADVLDMLIS